MKTADKHIFTYGGSKSGNGDETNSTTDGTVIGQFTQDGLDICGNLVIDGTLQIGNPIITFAELYSSDASSLTLNPVSANS